MRPPAAYGPGGMRVAGSAFLDAVTDAPPATRCRGRRRRGGLKYGPRARDRDRQSERCRAQPRHAGRAQAPANGRSQDPTQARRSSRLERTETDPFGHVQPADEFGQRCDDLIALRVDIEANIVPGTQHGLQGGDRVGAMDPRPGDLGPVEFGYPAAAVRQPVEHRVVEGDHHAIGGQAGIGLDVPEAHVHGPAERPKGVLRRFIAPAAVGERQRSVVLQVRRRIGDGAEVSDAGSVARRWVGTAGGGQRSSPRSGLLPRAPVPSRS